jgi:hypothetical protein
VSIYLGCIPLTHKGDPTKGEPDVVVQPDLEAIWKKLQKGLAQFTPPIHARRADFNIVEEEPQWHEFQGARATLECTPSPSSDALHGHNPNPTDSDSVLGILEPEQNSNGTAAAAPPTPAPAVPSFAGSSTQRPSESASQIAAHLPLPLPSPDVLTSLSLAKTVPPLPALSHDEWEELTTEVFEQEERIQQERREWERQRQQQQQAAAAVKGGAASVISASSDSGATASISSSSQAVAQPLSRRVIRGPSADWAPSRSVVMERNQITLLSVQEEQAARAAAGQIPSAAEVQRKYAAVLARALTDEGCPPRFRPGGPFTPEEMQMTREHAAFLHTNYCEPGVSNVRTDIDQLLLTDFPDIQSWNHGPTSIYIGCIRLKIKGDPNKGEPDVVVQPNLKSIWQRLRKALAELNPPIHARRADFRFVEETPECQLFEAAQTNLLRSCCDPRCRV